MLLSQCTTVGDTHSFRTRLSHIQIVIENSEDTAFDLMSLECHLFPVTSFYDYREKSAALF